MVSLSAASLESGQRDPVVSSDTHRSGSGFWALTVGSVGVVYGDIGTSPLYAFREAIVAAAGNGVATRPAVLGVLSLIVWALIVVVTLKYVAILLRADNNGEGGTLALMALAQKAFVKPLPGIMLCGLIGSALFFGDAMITPAISVLSAVEGLKLATPLFEPYVIPITVVVLIGLFSVQSRGTARVAAMFGPITVVWFLVIAAAGLVQIAQHPEILAALNPLHAVTFLWSSGYIGFVTLGAVFLAVTGAEALYADLGHFGRRPIQFAWITLVLPALLINYLGQGALVLADPKAIENPFYRMVPDSLLLPMVLLATAATVIASQAVITGAYSLARQAVQLGFLPRLHVQHTSDVLVGQIYMPQINLLLLVGVLVLVALFKTSSNLATAYGIAVTGTMIVTAAMAFVVIWKRWSWPLWAAAAVMAPLAFVDVVFLASNLIKVVEGGWITLLVGGSMLVIMLTWRRGTEIVMEQAKTNEIPLDDLVHALTKKPPQLIEGGTGIYLTSQPDRAPTAFLHTLKHFRVMHERVVIMSIRTASVPRVSPEKSVTVRELSPRFWQIEVVCGFRETPNVPRVLATVRKLGWKFDIMSTSFILSRRSFKPAARSRMPLWQDQLFIALAEHAMDATEYFRIPKERVVEIGTQVGI